MNIGGYAPPQRYQELYKDPEFFEYQYKKYVEHLAKPGDDNWQAPSKKQNETQQSSTPSSNPSYADREESAMGTETDGFGANKGATNEQEEMINITSCNYNEFAKYMINQYGEQGFNQGFRTIKDQQTLIYEENGEEKLISMLKGLFKDEDTTKRFINFCTTYLIVQNMA